MARHFLQELINKTKEIDSYSLENAIIIAEAGVNHEGSLEIAKRLIDEAAEGGADAIKFQTYRASTIASKHSPAYWDIHKEPTTSQYQLFQMYDKFWKPEFEELKVYCDVVGIEFLSTPFDLESAQFLNDLMGVFKISSSDITNKPFIKYLCQFGKPIILSPGASNVEEIDQALSWIDRFDLPVALLHCILNYTTPSEHANLRMILDLKQRYPNRIIGYSDHTLPEDMRTIEVAWLLGAQIIEKHFTHDKSLIGNDHYHAMNKEDLIAFRQGESRLKIVLGERRKRALDSESLARQHARRSLVAARVISKGSKILPGMLTWKRPAHGISPAEIDTVVGAIAAVDIDQDELLTWDMLR